MDDDRADSVEELLGRICTSNELCDQIRGADFALVLWHDGDGFGYGGTGEMVAEDLMWCRRAVEEIELVYLGELFGLGGEDEEEEDE